MTLQTSGPISIGNIGTEFGIPTPTLMSQLYRDGTYIQRNNTNVPTNGAISIGQFYGAIKGFVYSPTISGNAYNYSLRASAIAAGWNQTSPLIANITITGVLGSTSTSSPAFDDAGTYPAGSSYILTVNGGSYIIGAGGYGGDGGVWGGGGAGTAGGDAMHLSGTSITKVIVNNGTISGGGGGGGGGYGCTWSSGYGGRYGGAGGGGAGAYGGHGGNYGAGPSAGNGSYPGGSTAAGSDGTLTAGGIGSGAWICGANGAAGGGMGGVGVSSSGAGGAAGLCTSGNASVSAYSGTGVRYGTLG